MFSIPPGKSGKGRQFFLGKDKFLLYPLTGLKIYWHFVTIYTPFARSVGSTAQTSKAQVKQEN